MQFPWQHVYTTLLHAAARHGMSPDAVSFVVIVHKSPLCCRCFHHSTIQPPRMLTVQPPRMLTVQPPRILQHVVACLSDSEIAVRVDAAVAIRHFVDEAEDLGVLRSILPNLLGSIFQLMSEVRVKDCEQSMGVWTLACAPQLECYCRPQLTPLFASTASFVRLSFPLCLAFPSSALCLSIFHSLPFHLPLFSVLPLAF